MQLRQPIVTILGHVDAGKTTLLDSIRKTAIAAKEAGGITQAIGTTEIPLETVKSICGPIIERFKFQVTVPGLLFIDTPGHEAFTTLRKRGGSIADFAIIVVDIIEGIMPQTKESIEILKQTKTPFAIAVNKIDRISGWQTYDESFLKNVNEQRKDVLENFESSFYSIVNQFYSHGFAVDRFDRVQDFANTVAAVPVSGKTGEGIPELLAIVIGLSQQFLKNRLVRTEQGAGMIMEVKEFTGLGTAIDVILYDGSAQKNDFLVIGGKSPRITKIRALLLPEPLRDIRTERKFRNVDIVVAASGIKISAPDIDDVIAGSPIRTAKSREEAEQLLDELEKEVEETEIVSENQGLILKSDTLGGLEALISIFKEHAIEQATIGQVTKSDIIKAENNDDEYKIVIGFNTKTSEESRNFAKDKGVKILESDIIYRLSEGYEKWKEEMKEEKKKKELEEITRPGKLKILPGFVFRASNPAIVGCEVEGVVKPGYKLMKSEKDVGEIKQIQSQGENVSEAKTGDKVAISISGPTVGRQINESDVLYTDVNSEEYKKLKKNEQLLTEMEKRILEEIKNIKQKSDPMWGY